MAKCKVPVRALPEVFLFQFCPVIALVVTQCYQVGLERKFEVQSYLGNMEKGHENQGQLQGNAPEMSNLLPGYSTLNKWLGCCFGEGS